MPQADSVDKIITRYFACLARERFEYRETLYTPKPLTVSPLLLRGYTCPVKCGGCCPKFSLDYLPHEEHPDGVTLRLIHFNRRQIRIYSDMQKENELSVCQNLRQEDGRCGIYLVRPFSCDFELIRTLEFSSNHPNVLTQKLFGRGWNMKRVDGKRGALCEMTPPDDASIADVIRKLRRFKEWADHFGITTWAETIIDLIESRRLRSAITLDPHPKRKGFGR